MSEVAVMGDYRALDERIARLRWNTLSGWYVEHAPDDWPRDGATVEVVRSADYLGAVDALDKALRLLAQAQPGPSLQPGDDQRQWWDEATALLHARGR